MDLLEKIWREGLTEDEAERVFFETADAKGVTDVYAELGMSTIESTGYLHGAPFEDLARFRYEGWPSVCSRCGMEIKLEVGYWTLNTEGVEVRIRHLDCDLGQPASRPF